MVSAAVGGYRNEQAIAVGYAHNSDNNKWSVKTGVSVNTRKDVNWGGSARLSMVRPEGVGRFRRPVEE